MNGSPVAQLLQHAQAAAAARQAATAAAHATAAAAEHTRPGKTAHDGQAAADAGQ